MPVARVRDHIEFEGFAKLICVVHSILSTSNDKGPRQKVILQVDHNQGGAATSNGQPFAKRSLQFI